MVCNVNKNYGIFIDIQSQSHTIIISKSCRHLGKMDNLGGIKVVKLYDLSEFY